MDDQNTTPRNIRSSQYAHLLPITGHYYRITRVFSKGQWDQIQQRIQLPPAPLLALILDPFVAPRGSGWQSRAGVRGVVSSRYGERENSRSIDLSTSASRSSRGSGHLGPLFLLSAWNRRPLPSIYYLNLTILVPNKELGDSRRGYSLLLDFKSLKDQALWMNGLKFKFLFQGIQMIIFWKKFEKA